MAEITNLEQSKLDLIAEIEKRVNDKIIEKSNADLLIKLINNAESLTEAIAIAELEQLISELVCILIKDWKNLETLLNIFLKTII